MGFVAVSPISVHAATNITVKKSDILPLPAERAPGFPCGGISFQAGHGNTGRKLQAALRQIKGKRAPNLQQMPGRKRPVPDAVFQTGYQCAGTFDY